MNFYPTQSEQVEFCNKDNQVSIFPNTIAQIVPPSGVEPIPVQDTLNMVNEFLNQNQNMLNFQSKTNLNVVNSDSDENTDELINSGRK